jgi:hypothetical protein
MSSSLHLPSPICSLSNISGGNVSILPDCSGHKGQEHFTFISGAHMRKLDYFSYISVQSQKDTILCTFVEVYQSSCT